MPQGMNDIDIKDFTPVSGVGGNDNILLVLSSGVNGRISVALFKAAVSDSLKPSIRDGVWWVGDIGTGVVAEGKTPEFRKTETGIEYKYIPDPDTTWRLLVDIADIKLRFEDLTEDEVRMLIPHLKDFTPEEIAELQRPAAEMIAKLEDTDRTVSSNEQTRISNENARIGNENIRKRQENDRILFENKRAEAETAREKGFKESTKKAEEAATSAQNQADRAQAYADNPAKIGGNGNWWVWDEETGEYRDTGTFARGDIMFAAFDIDIAKGELVCTTPDKYTGPVFTLDDGELCLTING